jgi:hypothetical protein
MLIVNNMLESSDVIFYGAVSVISGRIEVTRI